MSNLKFAFRTLFKTPFVTIVAIVSLALGIGANAAIFSLFNQMLLQPLPAAEPNRLVNLLVPGPKPGSQSCNQASTRGNCDDVLSYPMFRDLEREKQVNPWSERMDNRRNYFLYVFGRLKPGVSIEQARASLDPQYRAIVNDVEATLQTGMSPQTLARFKTKPILLEPGARGQSAIPNTARPSLRLLLGVTAFVRL